MKRFLSFILCVIMLASALTLTGCKDKNAVGEAWEIKAYVTDQTQSATVAQKVGFKVNRNSSSIKDVWINIQEIDGENIKLTFCKYKTNSEMSTELYENGSVMDNGPRVITAQQVKDANKSTKGWIKVNASDWNLSNDSVLMIIDGKAIIREIVFVNTKGERLSASINKAYVAVVVKEKGQDKKTLLKEFSSSELEAYTETAVYGIPNFLLDNQEAFDSKDAK